MSQYPFELRMDDVEMVSDNLSFDAFFESVGINVKTLRTLWRCSKGEIYFDEQDLKTFYNSLDPDVRSELELDPDAWNELEHDLLDLNRDSHNANRMSWSEYKALEKESLGPFSDGRAFIVGKLEYGQTDPDGKKSRQTHKITAPIWLREPSPGAPMPPSYSYQIHLEVDGEDYVKKVPISHALRKEKTDRILLVIAARKSSIHEFDLTLRYNETQIRSRPVKLDLFLSRLDAPYVEEEVTAQPAIED